MSYIRRKKDCDSQEVTISVDNPLDSQLINEALFLEYLHILDMLRRHNEASISEVSTMLGISYATRKKIAKIFNESDRGLIKDHSSLMYVINDMGTSVYSLIVWGRVWETIFQFGAKLSLTITRDPSYPWFPKGHRYSKDYRMNYKNFLFDFEDMRIPSKRDLKILSKLGK